MSIRCIYFFSWDSILKSLILGSPNLTSFFLFRVLILIWRSNWTYRWFLLFPISLLWSFFPPLDVIFELNIVCSFFSLAKIQGLQIYTRGSLILFFNITLFPHFSCFSHQVFLGFFFLYNKRSWIWSLSMHFLVSFLLLLLKNWF